MALQTSTLRPGFLVSVKTSVRGNVSYSKQEIESAHIDETGAQKARWETSRVIADPVEQEAAAKARSKAQGLIRAICTQSAFGMLCPETEGENLDKAIVAARKIADEFNATAKLTRVAIYIMTGRIAPDDVEAIKAINSEVRELMERMQDGIARMDVKAVREAASRAKEVGSMLTADSQARVQIAVEAARAAATQIVKAGEVAGLEIDKVAIAKITEMRTAFLDLDGEGKPIEAPKASAASLDLEPVKPIGPVSFIEKSQPAEID
jgi:hypothetical protein